MPFAPRADHLRSGAWSRFSSRLPNASGKGRSSPPPPPSPPAATARPPPSHVSACHSPSLRLGAMSGLVRGLVALPILPVRAVRGLVRAPLGFLLLFLGPRRRSFTLPVAGLDEAKAQPIWFALRRAATTPEVRGVVRWQQDCGPRPPSRSAAAPSAGASWLDCQAPSRLAAAGGGDCRPLAGGAAGLPGGLCPAAAGAGGR